MHLVDFIIRTICDTGGVVQKYIYVILLFSLFCRHIVSFSFL